MQGADTVELPATGRFVRPQFLVPAALVAVAAIVATVLARWDPGMESIETPLLVFGIRWYELARFRLVHRSGWLLVYALFMSLCMLGETGLQQHWQLRMTVGFLLLVLIVTMFVQQRSHQLRAVESGEQRADQDGPDWPLGGFLAGVFAMLLGPLFALGTPMDPFRWLSLLLTLPLIWLQVRRSRYFPGLTSTFFLLLIVQECVRRAAVGAWDELWQLAGSAAFVTVLWLYLTMSARVRRTFTAPLTAPAAA